MGLNRKKQVLFMIAIFICFFQIHAQEIIVESIKSAKPPSIKGKRIIYTIDFSFLSCPEDHWFYYNSKKNLLICNFYGYHIEKIPDKLKGVPLIREIKFKNMETNLALNSKRSQLHLSLESGWHYSSSKVSGEVIRLQLWKYLKPEEVIKGKKNRFWKAFLIILASAGITVTIFSYYLN